MKILADHPTFEQAVAKPPQTGIRRSNVGEWVAVVDGQLRDTFTGAGAKAQAIRVAGTNRVVS
jgi:hypothetical protein